MKDKIINILCFIVKGWRKRAILISYVTIIAIVVNGWYIDVAGIIEGNDNYFATIKATYGNIDLYDVLACIVITMFYIVYLFISYKSNIKRDVPISIKIDNKNKSQAAHNINNGTVINYYGDNLAKIETVTQNDIFETIYIPYFNKIFNVLNTIKYSNWTYGLALTGEVMISRKQVDNLQETAKYCLSRVSHKGYEKYDNLIKDLGRLLKDLSELIELHTNETSDRVLRVDKFYHIKEYNPNLYNHLHDIYEKYVTLISDLTFELTRLLNYILEEVRTKNPTFLIDLGVLKVGSNDLTIEYKPDEKSDSPYPGINDFIKINEHRALHYSSSFDYKVDLFWKV